VVFIYRGLTCVEGYLKGHSEECGILEAPIISREEKGEHARLLIINGMTD